ncbi:hypothetical protein IE81DRAFT_350381 [Ceraceosorus guamensis]|uniref:Class E vacuolar protein-sorting machinery protein HSE1 n=1 Tax=Ceraceosorus guamensis TaxID=1522189 RepID=A0A316VNP6_9BASI|nr:hypothetical protein IE81DRAFT_350381 [Ceraceosorus guamensis]PWN39196.1 hypothetical protein IE81DRAFT_350381 [Ceraceosorus guamensis]
MFKSTNAYDDLVQRATSENLTSENWDLNLTVCEKVSKAGSQGARDVVASLSRRIQHKSANVQLFSLTLCDSLCKNVGADAKRELAGKGFLDQIKRLLKDATAHMVVKQKTWRLLNEWNTEWGNREEGGLLSETLQSLRGQGISFDVQQPAAPPKPSPAQLSREDEELQRVLELSKLDVGGRSSYTPSAADSSGYVPNTTSTSSSTAFSSAPSAPSQPSVVETPTVQAAPAKVRALYDFAPTEHNELAFYKGDVIRVLDSLYEHWWRGELRGQAGIFPVNYVEPLPDKTPVELQKEAEAEAAVFAEAANIDKLVNKLRSFDPARQSLAEDDELQDLYQQCISLRPKIVRLMEQYNHKVTDLRNLNDSYIHARGVFDSAIAGSQAQPHFGAPHQAPTPTLQRADSFASTAHSDGRAPSAQPFSPYAPQQAAPWAPGWHQQQQYPQQPASSAQYQAPPPPHQQQAQQQHQPQGQMYPNPNDPGYAAWYYSQPQFQQGAPTHAQQ